MCRAEAKNHPPMAALEITLPCPPAFLFQQIVVVGTELKEVCVAGDDDLVRIRKGISRIGGHHFFYQPAIGAFVSARSGWVKARALEELPGRTRHDKTMMSVTTRR